jgi:hypothetical protein
MVEDAASSTLFSYVSWGGFGKGYFLQIMYFTSEKSSFGCKKANSLDLLKHVYHSRKTIYVQSQNISYIVSLSDELDSKKYFTQIIVLKVE